MGEDNEYEKNIEQAQKEQIQAYEKLRKIADSDEFKEYFDFLIKTVTDKMIWGFGTHLKAVGGVDGKGKPLTETVDNISDWNEFCKWRGEIVARLQPIQHVMSAGAMKDYLKKQLDNYYKT